MKNNKKKVVLLSMAILIVLVSVYFIIKILFTEPIEDMPIDTNEPTTPVDIVEPNITVDISEPTIPIDTSEPVIPVDTSEPTIPDDASKIMIGDYYEGCKYYYDYEYYHGYDDGEPRLMKWVADNDEDFWKIYIETMYEFSPEMDFATYDFPHKLGSNVIVEYKYTTIDYAKHGDDYYLFTDENNQGAYSAKISLQEFLTGNKAIQKAFELGAVQSEIDLITERGDHLLMIKYTYDTFTDYTYSRATIGVVDENGYLLFRNNLSQSEENIALARTDDEKWKLIFAYSDSDNPRFKPVIIITGNEPGYYEFGGVIYFDDK